MNISRDNKDALNATLTVKIGKEDYQERVDKVLKDYKKKARIDGFRPGHVPQGLINKLYGVPVKVDEINKLISESITRYISDEKINILGDPLPAEKDLSGIDWNTQDEFEFSFDLGLSPDFELGVNAKTKVPYYKVTISEEMTQRYVDEVARRNGIFVLTDTIEKDEMVKGNFTELGADGNPLPEGHTAEDVILSVDVIKDEEIKNFFIGKKVTDEVDFDVIKAFPNEPDRISMLKTDKDKLGSLQSNFRFHITEIKKFEKAPVNQELFDKTYGEGEVKSEEEFRARVNKEIEGSLEKDCEYRFSLDARKIVMEKTQFNLPAEFLKRWMLSTNDGKLTQEQLEHEFDHFQEDLKWQLIKNKIGKDNDLKISEEEIKEFAKNLARNQYLRYGLANVPDEYLENYAGEMLKNRDEVRRMSEKVFEDKVIGWLKGFVKIEDKEISLDEFNKLFEK